MPTQRRPRIEPGQAEIIDIIRKRVPFEVEVEELLGFALDLMIVERRGEKPRSATDSELLMSLLSSDWFGFDGERFEKAAQDTLSAWRADMDRFAEDEAHEEALEAEEEHDDD